MEEPDPSPGEPDEAPPPGQPPKESPSKMARLAGAAASVISHRQLIVAAMEMLRDKRALSEEEEVKILSAYEQGTAAARSALNDLLERLQSAKLGKVFIRLSQAVPSELQTAEGIRTAARPFLEAAKEGIRAEARPYVEQAKERLRELKALEEPTLRRLEAISENIKDAGREVAQGLKGAGREAADELVRRGRRWWMSAETEEMERELFDWVLRTLPKAEQVLIRLLVGLGLVMFVAGVLLVAEQFNVLKNLARYLGIGLLIFLGFMMMNWGVKLREAMKLGRGEIERVARMTPQERRVFLTKRWAERAQREGIISSVEAEDVVEQTIRAVEPGSGGLPPKSSPP